MKQADQLRFKFSLTFLSRNSISTKSIYLHHWPSICIADADSAEATEGDGRITGSTLRCPAHACMQCQRITALSLRSYFWRVSDSPRLPATVHFESSFLR